MDSNVKQPAKRRSKFAGREDVSCETMNSIVTDQIDQLREISRVSDQAAAKIQESVDVLYNKQIPVNTEKLEQLNRYFISEMESKLRKVKRPSKGLVWYIVMWVMTLASGWLGGYFVYDRQQWKERATYWYNERQALTTPEK